MGGELLDDLVAFTTKKNLSGIEALSAIPGTVGAAPVQNVGAYGQEIEQVLESVHAYDLKEEKYVTIKKEDMNLGYRQSIFNQGKELGVVVPLHIGTKFFKRFIHWHHMRFTTVGKYRRLPGET